MRLDEKFYEPEEREGFLVDSRMKRVWAAELEVLLEIKRICEKNHIRYYADWGTLLGAIRHQGFIPWDDDLDIGMLRDDWFRFMEVAPTELGKWFELKNVYNDPTHDNVLARVISGRHMNFDREYLECFHHCPYVVGVDIFAIDYINRDEAKLRTQLDVIELLMQSASSLSKEPPYTQTDKDMVEQLEEAFGIQIDWKNRLLHELKKNVDQISSMYGSRDADMVGSMMRLSGWQPEYRIPKEWYEDVVEVPFEYTTIPVPRHYDKILKLKYGENYMTPINRNGGHDYPFYKFQDMALKEVVEKEFGLELTIEDIRKLIDEKTFGAGCF